jgi:hypothetical protein
VTRTTVPVAVRACRHTLRALSSVSGQDRFPAIMRTCHTVSRTSRPSAARVAWFNDGKHDPPAGTLADCNERIRDDWRRVARAVAAALGVAIGGGA